MRERQLEGLRVKPVQKEAGMLMEPPLHSKQIATIW